MERNPERRANDWGFLGVWQIVLSGLRSELRLVFKLFTVFWTRRKYTVKWAWEVKKALSLLSPPHTVWSVVKDLVSNDFQCPDEDISSCVLWLTHLSLMPLKTKISCVGLSVSGSEPLFVSEQWSCWVSCQQKARKSWCFRWWIQTSSVGRTQDFLRLDHQRGSWCLKTRHLCSRHCAQRTSIIFLLSVIRLTSLRCAAKQKSCSRVFQVVTLYLNCIQWPLPSWGQSHMVNILNSGQAVFIQGVLACKKMMFRQRWFHNFANELG